MRPVRRDPAPSRWSYRFQRLWLTPLFRKAMRFGVPMVLVCGGTLLWFSDDMRREEFVATIADMRRSVEERPEFMVNLMAIDGATEEVAEDIREILPVDFPVSSFGLDLEAMRARVEELDAVASADVLIRPGGILQVNIHERLPVVVWRGPQGIELLDAEGHRTAGVASRMARPDLPLIAGEGGWRVVPEAQALFAAAEPIAGRLRGLIRIGERRWDVVLEDGARILLPEERPVLALERLVAIHQAERLLDREISAVDLRNPARPTVRLSAAADAYLHNFRKASTGE